MGDADVLIVDGYVDEPALLGVPPYISPEPRLLAGVAGELGLKWSYVTIDEVREKGIPPCDITLVYGGVTVPGKYLGGRPMSEKEAEQIAQSSRESYIGGPLARYGRVTGFSHVVEKDLCAFFHDSFTGTPTDRWATVKEMARWGQRGAGVVREHPWHRGPLMAEIETYRGCVRYFTGGCSFCSEPGYGKPEFRPVEDITGEIYALYQEGVRHFRLGGQSCIISYGAKGVGKTETPVPHPEKVGELFRGIRKACPDLETLHVDNANPAVIWKHPNESSEILTTIARYGTAGNVLALGMESADPEVIRRNNLNARPHEVRGAVELINRAGSEREENGLPRLLPGLNFISGLPGESPDTFNLNYEFLKSILDDGLLLRRINIRKVLAEGREVNIKHPREHRAFKERVRMDIDRPMLEKVIPLGTVLRSVYMEERRGHTTFGRQAGTYPILVGVRYPLELNQYHHIAVTEHGQRSVTGVHQPFIIHEAGFKQLEALPGIGSKRAAAIFKKGPRNMEEFRDTVKDDDLVRILEKIVSF